MPRAVVIQLAGSDPPGWLGEWLPAAGLELDVIRPYEGEPVPSTVPGDALIVLGGEMSAYEEGRAPWLRPTRALLSAAVAADVPTLGVCLGAQLLAVQFGGRVQVSDPAGPEIGLCEVSMAAAAVGDHLLGTLPPRVPAIQWHYDGVAEVPLDAVVLASSPRYACQAFRIGDSTWGIQWHPEVTPEIAASWAAHDSGALGANGLDAVALLDAFVSRQQELIDTWRPMATRFAVTAAAAAQRRQHRLEP